MSVIAALNTTPLPPALSERVICEFGVDVRSEDALRNVLHKYADSIDTVWNLAAPLSVATAKDPTHARNVTVLGMQRLLEAMRAVGLRKICFSDSIGSFGAEAPRDDASACWLLEHPTQDPGSEYGRQKRECRELLREYAERYGFDTRFAILPGVLHRRSTWGGGTTEYALDALMAAARMIPYACPLPLDARLPMIYIDDLVRGLIALMDAPVESLREREHGYTLAGFSFTPAELFATVADIAPDLRFAFRIDLTANPHAQLFASLWPDSISKTEATRDLGFTAQWDLPSTVSAILMAFRTYIAKEQ